MENTYDVPLFIDKTCLLTSPDEKILVVKRQHWTVAALPILSLFVGSILATSIVYFILVSFFGQLILFVIGASVIFALFFSVATNKLLHWYSHIYFITTHKASEICCTFRGQKTLQEVSLENTLCSEIESSSEGLINSIFQTGDVTISIDTAESEEEIHFRSLSSPHQTSDMLARHFNLIPSDSEKNHKWYSASEDSLRRFLHKQLWNISGGML